MEEVVVWRGEPEGEAGTAVSSFRESLGSLSMERQSLFVRQIKSERV